MTYIRMEPDVVVSSRIPGTTSNVTNFFAPVGPGHQNPGIVTTFTRHGARQGQITDFSAQVSLLCRITNRTITFQNVIRTNQVTQIGDSGSALVGDTRVFGTLAGGWTNHTNGTGWTIFSPGPLYSWIS